MIETGSAQSLESHINDCPFCGAPGAIDESFVFLFWGKLYFCGCTNIKCPMELSSPYFGTPEEAIECWNTRPTEKHTPQ